jgi:hypothetical protein
VGCSHPACPDDADANNLCHLKLRSNHAREPVPIHPAAKAGNPLGVSLDSAASRHVPGHPDHGKR